MLNNIVLPAIKCSHWLDCPLEDDCNGILLVVCNEHGKEPVEYHRINQRWRCEKSPYISKHAIASKLFRYPSPPSEDQIEYMGGYVELIGNLIDQCNDILRRRVDEHLRKREEKLQRQKEEADAIWIAEHLKNTAYKPQATYIYLMSHTNGLTKIGRSNNPQAREKTLQAEDPRLEMIFCCKADAEIEGRLHEIYSELRVRGEWFRLDQHHIDWIRKVVTARNRIQQESTK